MLLLIVFCSVFSPVIFQEFGEMHHILTFAFSNQLNTVMSSCCVIRHLQCPVRQPQKMTSQQNVTTNLVRGLESFSHCVCQNHRRCSFLFPASYLPDDADGITYDVTFVTITTTARYTCTYSGTRALACQYRQGMRTGLVGWLMPGLGAYGPLEVLGRAGYLGEEVEEAMEAVVESGLRPSPRSRDWQSCRRCIPLQCAVRVSREAERIRLFLRRALSAWRQRQRYHWCLRQNSVRPPQPPPTTPTPTTTTTTTTTLKPLGPFPVTPPPDLPHPPLPPTPLPWPTIPPPATTLGRTTPTTTPTRPPLHVTAGVVATTTTTPTTHTTTTTSIATTTRQLVTTTPNVPNSSPVFSTPLPPPPTTPGTNVTTTATATTTSATASPTTAWIVTPTTALEVTSPPMTSPMTEMTTTTTPIVITRILVGSPAATPASPSKKNAVGVGTEMGGAGILGGGGVAGVVIGLTVVVATVIACLFILHRRRRRRHRHSLRDDVDGAGLPPSSRKKSRSSNRGRHLKARNLPSVSSKQAVIDGEDADNASDKMEDENDDDNSNGDGEIIEDRYVSEPTFIRSTKPQQYLNQEDDRSLYASLDETAISLSNPAFREEGADLSGSTVGSEVKNKTRSDYKLYYNIVGLLPDRADMTNQTSRSFCHKVPMVHTVSGSAATDDVAKRALSISRKNVCKASSSPGDSPLSRQSSGSSSKYYNLRPGPPKGGNVSPYVSDTSSYVNVASLNTGHYDKPSQQATQHVYTTLREPSATTTASHNDQYYLEPCASSGKCGVSSRATGGSKKRAKRTRSNPVSEHPKIVQTVSNSSSSGSIQDREANLAGAVRKVSVGSNSSREDSTQTPTRGSDCRAQNSSRTILPSQDTKPTACLSTVDPKTDHEGYLLPVTPRRQQQQL